MSLRATTTVADVMREDGYLSTKELEDLRGGKIDAKLSIVSAAGELYSRLAGGFWRRWL